MPDPCTGYRWSHGQYTMASCTQESSTFFVILGFTMLVLLILLGLILIIACFRRQRPTNAPPSGSTGGAPGNQQDCVIQMDGSGQFSGKNFESVKCVIMAGEDKPTFLAHPVIPFHPETHEDSQVKEKELPEAVGETSKQQLHQEEGDRV